MGLLSFAKKKEDIGNTMHDMGDSHMPSPPMPSAMHPEALHALPPPPLPPKPEVQKPDFSPPRSTVPPPPRAFVPPAPRPVQRIGAMEVPRPVQKPQPEIKHDFTDLHSPSKKMPVPESLKPELPAPSLPESKPIKQRREVGPVYVRAEDFRKILEDLVMIENDVKQSEAIMIRLNELKNEKDRQFLAWKDELEDIQRKLVFIDDNLFER